MDNPVCDYCDDSIEDGEDYIHISGGKVHRGEPQGDAGGGMFHDDCSVKYLKETYL